MGKTLSIFCALAATSLNACIVKLDPGSNPSISCDDTTPCPENFSCIADVCIPEGENQLPSISIGTIERSIDTIIAPISVVDALERDIEIQGVLVNGSEEYELSLSPAIVSASIAGTSSNLSFNIPELDQSVLNEGLILRLSPSVGSLLGATVSSQEFSFGNTAPEIISFDFGTELNASGLVTLHVVLADAENDSLSISNFSLEFEASESNCGPEVDTSASQDLLQEQQPNIFDVASFENLSSTPEGFEHVLVWRSPVSCAGNSSNSTLNMTIEDSFGAQHSASIEGFSIINQTKPIVTGLRAYAAEQIGQLRIIPIEYTVTDNERDQVDIEVEYSLDFGQSWHPATEFPNYRSEGFYDHDANADGVGHRFDWSVESDIVNSSNATRLRIRAADEFGQGGAAVLVLDTPVLDDSESLDWLEQSPAEILNEDVFPLLSDARPHWSDSPEAFPHSQSPGRLFFVDATGDQVEDLFVVDGLGLSSIDPIEVGLEFSMRPFPLGPSPAPSDPDLLHYDFDAEGTSSEAAVDTLVANLDGLGCPEFIRLVQRPQFSAGAESSILEIYEGKQDGGGACDLAASNNPFHFSTGPKAVIDLGASTPEFCGSSIRALSHSGPDESILIAGVQSEAGEACDSGTLLFFVLNLDTGAGAWSVSEWIPVGSPVFGVGAYANVVSTGDVDGDGLDDVIRGHEQSLYTAFGDGMGNFSNWVLWPQSAEFEGELERILFYRDDDGAALYTLERHIQNPMVSNYYLGRLGLRLATQNAVFSSPKRRITSGEIRISDFAIKPSDSGDKDLYVYIEDRSGINTYVVERHQPTRGGVTIEREHFQSTQSTVTGGGVTSADELLSIDANQDGFLDIVQLSGGNLYLWVQKSNFGGVAQPNFEEIQITNNLNISLLTKADLQGDGLADLILVTSPSPGTSDSVFWIPALGAEDTLSTESPQHYFGEAQLLAEGMSTTEKIVPARLNASTQIDLLFVHSASRTDESFSVLVNDGTANFSSIVDIPLLPAQQAPGGDSCAGSDPLDDELELHDALAADLDFDGQDELILSIISTHSCPGSAPDNFPNTTLVVKFDGDTVIPSALLKHTLKPETELSLRPLVVDANKDGRLDILTLISTPSGAQYFKNRSTLGNLDFEAAIDVSWVFDSPLPIGPIVASKAALGDINFDGTADIVFNSSQGTTVVSIDDPESAPSIFASRISPEPSLGLPFLLVDADESRALDILSRGEDSLSAQHALVPALLENSVLRIVNANEDHFRVDPTQNPGLVFDTLDNFSKPQYLSFHLRPHTIPNPTMCGSQDDGSFNFLSRARHHLPIDLLRPASDVFDSGGLTRLKRRVDLQGRVRAALSASSPQVLDLVDNRVGLVIEVPLHDLHDTSSETAMGNSDNWTVVMCSPDFERDPQAPEFLLAISDEGPQGRGARFIPKPRWHRFDGDGNSLSPSAASIQYLPATTQRSAKIRIHTDKLGVFQVFYTP